MKAAFPFVLAYYDREIVKRICEKHGLSVLDAYRKFLFSETYAMLRDPALEMWDFGCVGIFDMWEAERVTGDPRNSIYLRSEEV